MTFRAVTDEQKAEVLRLCRDTRKGNQSIAQEVFGYNAKRMVERILEEAGIVRPSGRELMKRPVTQEQRRLIYRLYGDEGKSVKQVGVEVFGRDNAFGLVNRVLKEGGISPRSSRESRALQGTQFTEEQEAEIVRLYVEEGLGCKAISKAIMGRESPRPVDRILRKYGVKKRTMAEGKASSAAYRDAKRGAKPLPEIEKLKRKRLKGQSKCSDLELFEYGNKKRALRRHHKLYKTDPTYRVVSLLRTRLKNLIKTLNPDSRGGSNSRRMVELLGCSPDEFKSYLESRFEDWMTWENCGSEWVIDHIVPCKWFDQTNPEHLKLCWHHKNLRPLCKRFNNTKRARPMDFDPALVAGGSCETVRALRAFAFNHLVENKAPGYC